MVETRASSHKKPREETQVLPLTSLQAPTLEQLYNSSLYEDDGLGNFRLKTGYIRPPSTQEDNQQTPHQSIPGSPKTPTMSQVGTNYGSQRVQSKHGAYQEPTPEEIARYQNDDNFKRMMKHFLKEDR